MAPRVTPPSIQPKRPQILDLLVRQRLQLRRRDQPLLMSNLRHLLLNITPDERTALDKVVSLVVPGGIAASRSCGFTEQLVQRAQIVHVDLVPDVLALSNLYPLLALQDVLGQCVGLDARPFARSATRAVDARRAHDGRLHALRALLAGSEDDLVDLAVQGVVGEVGEFVNPVPVVVFFGSFDAPLLAAEVFESEDAGSGGVDDPYGLLGGVASGSVYDGLG